MNVGVLQAIVLNRLCYALPMCSKYLTSDMVDKIDAIFRKACKWHLVIKDYEMEDIAEMIQMKLF
jgi:hypothetical protein